MNEGQKLVERAKAKLGSYTAVADHLDLTSGMIGHVVAGRKYLPPFHAARLAELLGEDWAQHALPALAESARTSKEKAYWLGKLKRMATVGALGTAVTFGGLLAPQNTQASQEHKPGVAIVGRKRRHTPDLGSAMTALLEFVAPGPRAFAA